MKKTPILDIIIPVVLVVCYFTNQISLWVLLMFSVIYILKILAFFVFDNEENKEEF
jgi:hypothetical protein